MTIITPKFRLIILLLVLVTHLLSAQDQRTIETKIADVLALLPTDNNQKAEQLFLEIMNMDDEGLKLITGGVRPNGADEGIPYRYAVSLLTHYATTTHVKLKIERAYLSALQKSNNAEVKAYFMDNLKVIGSNESVYVLKDYVIQKDVFDPAISVLESIGTDDAKKLLLNTLPNQPADVQVRLIKALGELKYEPAVPALSQFATSENISLRKQALWSLALIADAGSYPVLLQQAKNGSFKNEASEATTALVEYLNQMMLKGNSQLVKEISKALLDNTQDISQQHFRLAALKGMTYSDSKAVVSILIKEINRFDDEYKKEVLKIAVNSASSAVAVKQWQKVYKKFSDADQSYILAMLAKANRNDGFVESTLIPALSSSGQQVRITAAAEMASYRSKKFTPALIDYLLRSSSDQDIVAAKTAILQLADTDTDASLANKVEGASSKIKITLLEMLGTRRAVDQFATVASQINSDDPTVKEAAYKALPNVSSGSNVNDLLRLLKATEDEKSLKAIQKAIIAGLDQSSLPLINDVYATSRIKVLPILPYVNDATALEKVVSTFYHGNDQEREVAFEALINWQNNQAVRSLIAIRKERSLAKYHVSAFKAIISQTEKSNWPDDQKLLMLREIMPLATDKNEKAAVIRAAGNVRTFLSLMFVANYLDDEEVASVASRSAMQIALPTADAKPGLTGIEVRKTLERMLDKLTGPDSQYERIDIKTYLESMPYTKGFESIFNGKDLTGWQGLVENPIARAKMKKEVLAKKQLEADAKVKENWSVKDGMIVFQGDGANLCTTRPYGDFEMIVDWRLSKNGDSGIYLRGTPQVQIWDIARTDVGAQVGSGGLYNNQSGTSVPLVVADNPIGEWNTFHIKMIGDKVTVYLNGVLVVNNVVLENYWDRSLPIFSEEAIELQAHGTDLAFRNLYVKELNTKPYELTAEEREQGFEILFNGKDLNNWVGNKTDYIVEDNTIAIYPSSGHGNLFSAKEYADFIFRFEFQLTPGANNGLGIHAPLEGDAAYVGKEIQILDNDAPVYATLQKYQYHGSVYGIMPAKRGFLKPTGDWNQEEVYVKGDFIRVTLNGTVILEGDIKKATKNGTLDHKDHPGLNRHSGHIGFLGHGSVVKFRSIRIKDLSAK